MLSARRSDSTNDDKLIGCPSLEFKFITNDDYYNKSEIHFTSEFETNKKMREKLTNPPSMYSGTGYSITFANSYDTISSEHAADFLDMLVAMKDEFGDEFIVEDYQLKILIKQLIDNHFLSTGHGSMYLQKIPTSLTLHGKKHLIREELEEIRSRVMRDGDFDGILKLAKRYQNETALEFDPDSAICYLCKATEFMPESVTIEDHIDLDAFFSTHKTLHQPDIFSKKNRVFLPALKRNNTIKSLKFGTGVRPHDINQYLADFIASSKTLKSIKIGSSWNIGSYDKLHAKDMDFLAFGLAESSSVEKL